MDQITLWGRLNSINVQKVLWTMEELAIDFSRIDAGLHFGVNKSEEYLQKNPNGLVPMIDDQGFILWESHTIMRYLAKKFDTMGHIYPQDQRLQAKIEQWQDWYNTVLWPPMRTLFWGYVRTPESQRNPEELENARQALIKALQILESQFGKFRFVASDYFTLADIPVALVAYRWFNLPIERPEFPNFAHWYEAIQGRSGFKNIHRIH
jgi:glutathione S-transferase